jgi:hypothetical protein
VRRIALPLAALALASPVPLRAQAQLSPEAEEALTCAVWASYFSVEYQGEDEEAALTNALNYYVGRYEGLTGQGIDEAVDDALIVEAANDLDALTPVCTARMEEYGGRMFEWGKALEDLAERVPGGEAVS